MQIEKGNFFFLEPTSMGGCLTFVLKFNSKEKKQGRDECLKMVMEKNLQVEGTEPCIQEVLTWCRDLMLTLRDVHCTERPQ